jgi:hypothetical protein
MIDKTQFSSRLVAYDRYLAAHFRCLTFALFYQIISTELEKDEHEYFEN